MLTTALNNDKQHELGKTLKDAVMAYLEELSRNLLASSPVNY
jgi:hypothetical protein